MITLYQISIPVFIKHLNGLAGCLKKAQALYAESEASRARREAALAQRRAERAGYQAPQSRPDKRARRLIRALGDIDAM